MPGHVARLGIGTTIAAMCLVAVSAQRLADPPTSVALYAGVGEELITFGVDVEHATLSRQSSLILPGFVQEAWSFPRRRFPLRRLEQRRLQLHRLRRRTAGRPARHHGLPSRRPWCTTPARSASVTAFTSHPHHWRWTRTISARGVQRSERRVRSRDQRRRQCGCRGASTRLARCRCLRASGSRPALEPRGRRRHSRQRTDCIFPRGPRRAEGLPLRCRQAVG